MKLIHILLVEDNEGDIELISDAFEEAKILTKMSIVKDGKSAIDFLCKLGEHQHVEMPDLMLLDVNLPKKNGLEVLKYVKGHSDFKHIPVIMLTTSSSIKDINTAYENYANCYITKPVGITNFLEVIATIENFWFSIVKLPSKRNNILC